MNDFIKAVKQVEDGAPDLEPVAVLKMLRRAAGLDDALVQRFLGSKDSSGPEVDAALSEYIRKSVNHAVTEDATEEGVVLTSDGTTVALRPLLLGLEAGFLSSSAGRVRGLYQLSLAQDLRLSLTHSSLLTWPPPRIDGCWNSLTSPEVFTLSDTASLLTTSQVNGGMDGLILGMEVSDTTRRPLKLSSLLTEYYCHQLEKSGLDAAPFLISRRRRKNFRDLVVIRELAKQVVKSVELQRRLRGESKLEEKEKKRLKSAVKQGMKQFVHMYMGEHENKPQRK